MAKHKIDGKGFVSKGQRVSCYGNVKHAPKQVAGNTNNAMLEALNNAKVLPSAVGSKLIGFCINAITNKRKPSDDEKRGWSAHLSYKTYQQLKAEGIMQ